MAFTIQPMKVWLTYLVLAVLLGFAWFWYLQTGNEIQAKLDWIDIQKAAGDPDDLVGRAQGEVMAMEGLKTFNGILLVFLSAGLVGIFFVLHILPSFAHRLTHAVYDSAEMMEHDVMHDARSLLAQGEYEEAIAAFHKAAAADPLNRLPWVEIVKIYKDYLKDSRAAIQTIRHALDSQEWEISDAAYFLFRLAELYDEVEGDRTSAVEIMQQVIEQFPNTRHSANARYKLQEWIAQDEAALAANEDASFQQPVEGSWEFEPEVAGENDDTQRPG